MLRIKTTVSIIFICILFQCTRAALDIENIAKEMKRVAGMEGLEKNILQYVSSERERLNKLKYIRDNMDKSLDDIKEFTTEGNPIAMYKFAKNFAQDWDKILGEHETRKFSQMYRQQIEDQLDHLLKVHKEKTKA
jgi:gas vesicle protein